MLVIGSIFRDAESYVDRYFDQIDVLRKYRRVRVVVAEGDSTDDTYTRIEERLWENDLLLRVDHGGPKFESVDDPQRWAQIALVDNAVLDALELEDSDKFVYVESDLIHPVDTLLNLAQHLDVVGACAAMSINGQNGRFYDTWGHVGMDGRRFRHEPPYHPSLVNVRPGELVEIQSAGSCIAVRGDIVNRGVEFSSEDCIRGFCRTIREHTPLFLDPEAYTFHA